LIAAAPKYFEALIFMSQYFSQWNNLEAGVAATGVMIINICLVVFLLVCAYTDGREGKIYNKWTFPAMGLGLLLNAVFGGFNGFVWSLLGWAVGMGIQWVPFMFGLAKAGDVKLLAAVGALKGWAFCLFGFLYGAIAFALLILPWLARRGELKAVGQNIGDYFKIAAITQTAPDAPVPVVQKRFVPWGVGLGIGFLVALAIELLFGRATWIRF
jgi:prepilin peptidase CpaA